jgi:prepilin-type N-terminal cleavage/methylation domain-containing protein
MEWCLMGLILHRKRNSAARPQSGMTMIELMIAMVVLAVGIVGSMALVVRAIGGDAASKQLTNSTAVAQMVTERIMAVPANTNTILTITDCTNTVYNVNTNPGGPAVTSSGDLDFTASTMAGYYMPYTDCGTANRAAAWDVRWNIAAIAGSSGYAKILTVSAQLKSAGNNRMVFAPVVTIRTIIGQGT